MSPINLNDIPENIDLSDIRKEIDSIDTQLLDLFVQRMNACG